ERAGDVAEWNLQGLGLGSIDRYVELGQVVAKRRKYRGKTRILICRSEQTVCRRGHAIESQVVFIQHLELEPPEVPDALNRRRIEREHLRIRFRSKRTVDAPEN